MIVVSRYQHFTSTCTKCPITLTQYQYSYLYYIKNVTVYILSQKVVSVQKSYSG